ncbi:helix-turn-helix domain-containing protein [Gaoshiqia sp. Z1-71]|uniref:helix-turn-helix domain-containing protein n=1 Tax=Gaoshiqia hydrogeniformans TaxID=3290090 RepID=UPI003BF7D605
MNNRIKQFIDQKGLTPSELADTIGVQRSNITHVLHGRNKPSFQFIAKLLESFPEIDAKWLIMGEGNMLNKPESQTKIHFQGEETPKKEPVPVENPQPSVKTESAPVKAKLNRDDLPVSGFSPNNKEIERIVVFYTDQTFKQYMPSN